MLPTLKSVPRCWACTRAHAENDSEGSRGMLRYPHTQRKLGALLLVQLAAVSQADLSFASVEGLGKTVKRFPVTRK